MEVTSVVGRSTHSLSDISLRDSGNQMEPGPFRDKPPVKTRKSRIMPGLLMRPEHNETKAKTEPRQCKTKTETETETKKCCGTETKNYETETETSLVNSVACEQ